MPALPFDPASLRALLFDLDGTLYAQGPVRRGMARELLAHLALHPVLGLGTIATLSTYRRMHEETRTREPGSGVRDWHFDEAARRARTTRDEVERLVEEWMVRRPLPRVARHVRRGLRELLTAAERRGLHAGVLSDYPVEEKLVALGLREHFDFTACTSDPAIDAPKPAPAGFHAACDLWGVPPEQVLYVGDREEVDRAGATAAGMPCVLVGKHLPGPSVHDFRELEGLLGWS